MKGDLKMNNNRRKAITQQPGNPQARPAFQAPSLPTHPQEHQPVGVGVHVVERADQASVRREGRRALDDVVSPKYIFW